MWYIHHRHTMKDKNHMIITTAAEKALDTIQHPLRRKMLSKGGKEGTYLNIIEATQDEPTASITSMGKHKSISLNMGHTMGMSALTSYSTEPRRSRPQQSDGRKQKAPTLESRTQSCGCGRRATAHTEP